MLEGGRGFVSSKATNDAGSSTFDGPDDLDLIIELVAAEIDLTRRPGLP